MENVRSEDGRVIGRIENRVFHRNARTKHFLTSPPAICVDVWTWKEYSPRFDTFEHHNIDDGKIYSITTSDFDKYKQELNRGYGDQYFVVLSKWTVSDIRDRYLLGD